jgi:L-threonylcarbamoyladenylate synthase
MRDLTPRSITEEAARAEAGTCLRDGHVVAYPTDTLYALGALATSTEAVRTVLRIKERLPEKTLPLIAADLDQVVWLTGPLSPLAARLAARWWPGPLTMVVDVCRPLAEGVVAPDGSVAVRIPAHDHVRDVVRRAGAPVTSTSANRSGDPPATTAGECLALDVAAEVDGQSGLAMVLDGGPAITRVPSTIVDVRNGDLRLLREGALPWSRVLHSTR